MTDDQLRTPAGDLHRLLDEAFAGVAMTPDAQDLKEEMRANLLARVAELVAAGRSPHEAARHAIAEVGDVRALLDGTPDPGSPAGSAAAAETWTNAAERHRVRPKPAFVVRVVVAALATVIGLGLAALGATDVLALPAGVLVLLTGIGATGIAWLVGDPLAQETTTSYPMPARRAGGYFFATLLGAFGLGLGGLIALGELPLWTVTFAALGVVAAIVLFAFLGATQTNRHKAWVRAIQREHSGVATRFDTDPAAAARFGIYTLVIWLVAFAVFVVLSLTVGWAWSWLALLGGFAAMMLLLARMLFGRTDA
ncbi:permease prefix domain 1-containing protein [Hamadaea tsunoensis]|uniref:permease prefix domain 1-containing protein n=1 Tax=Hamadaea tsunoensis TaxID=53368 RepID=UPI00041002F3|nr:permease prefix domain 1-containing protein [Hamadaea tsunoensis]